ncbi:L-2-hydroxyglutarate oxidase [Pseudoalteromonas aurantia]|uniref:L-2-hydroxyglutarate oxidase n=1 Tax=Pseudoalteromonas aurantia 208 TaxID=1314867 RepID=A0ABR9EG12_9GAMM|nr:L-2-hydroxyglutarate oxidase [Pseudoalteromonas aurantia]MBE0369943.1 L-2-hydroxyglutarate oxidase [Pseudoalteromonas aurantia 208]
MKSFDYVIIGSGIVGLSTALELKQSHPNATVAVIEKESELAIHQTGRNSGVIHAGVYYKSGSLKAEFCKAGSQATKDFCEEHNIEYQQPGKLVVATNQVELERLEKLHALCSENGIPAEEIDAHTLQAIEPNIIGLRALKFKQTAIVDYKVICQKKAELFTRMGGEILTSTELYSASETTESIHLKTSNGVIKTCYLVACAGLHADKVASMFNIPLDFRIIPFRGEYYELSQNEHNRVSHLIYPVPDPSLPFLGIHITPMVSGKVTVGPNAVLGWKREGYGKLNFCVKDAWINLSFLGFWKLLATYKHAALSELQNTFSKRRYLKEVQKYCPAIKLSDLQRFPTGIRAQAVTTNGKLIQDFLFKETQRSLHVCNAPSPAATSAIPISQYIVKKLKEKSAQC